jgi:hypothetical protein
MGRQWFALREHGLAVSFKRRGCGLAVDDKQIVVLPLEPRSREICGARPEPLAIDLLAFQMDERRSCMFAANFNPGTGDELLQ